MHKTDNKKYMDMYNEAMKVYPEMYDISYFSHTQDPAIRINSRNKSLPLEKRVESIENLLRMNFTRSIIASGYNTKHPDFKSYVAMRLYSDSIKENYSEDLYFVLVQKYGKKDGMKPWSSFYLIPENADEKGEY